MSAFPTTNLEPMFLGGGNGHGGHGHTGGVFVPGRVKAAFATTKGSDQHHQQHQDQQPAAQKKSEPPANTMENFPSLSMAVAVNKKK
jgi:hypothetical protein